MKHIPKETFHKYNDYTKYLQRKRGTGLIYIHLRLYKEIIEKVVLSKNT